MNNKFYINITGISFRTISSITYFINNNISNNNYTISL